MKRPIATIFAAILAGTSPGADPIDFAHDILPLLKARCAECHTNGKYKGGISFDTRALMVKSKSIVPGKSSESPMLLRVTESDPNKRMPLKGMPLTDKEIGVLRAWIDQGAPWQEGFSFAKGSYVSSRKPRRPELPPVRDGLTNPVDRILARYYRQHQVAPPAPLDDAAFARRVNLDLNGLLPAPQQLAAAAQDHRGNLIEDLLDDRQAYAEHWLTFWNDLLRNDYAGTGYIDGGRKAITGWLYQALLDNKPYDRFVRELISPKPESEGFIKGIKWRGVVNASQVPELQFSQNIAQVFLGINLKCASCHDSFIDSWRLEDAYSLAAVVADKPLEMHRCDKPTGAKVEARFLYPELGKLDAALPKTERLHRLADLLTSPENGRFTRTIVNRLWQRLMGRGLVEPVDVMSNEPWNADLLDFLAIDLVDHGYNLKHTIGLIVRSRAYQSQSALVDPSPLAGEGRVRGEDAYVFRGPFAKRMTAEQFVDAVWSITGTHPAKPAKDFEKTRAKQTVRASVVNSDVIMRSLGRPNREQVVTTRPEELSTLQALDLTNGQALADLLDRGAQGLRKQHPEWKAAELIEWLYRSALSRKPSVAELETAIQVAGTPITDAGLSDLLWTVFMMPEFQMVR